jgi:hypothetical protein
MDQLAVVIVDPIIVEKDRLVAVGAIGLVGLAIQSGRADAAMVVQDTTVHREHAVGGIDSVLAEPAAADALTPVIAVGRGDTSDTFFINTRAQRRRHALMYARITSLRCLACPPLAISAGFRRDT